MNNRHVAIQFLERFCAGDIDGLTPLLTEDLQLSGPFYQFRSRAAYLDSLGTDPLEARSFRVLSLTEDSNTVAIFDDYEKSTATLTIAQLFKFRNERISEMVLVFDGRESA